MFQHPTGLHRTRCIGHLCKQTKTHACAEGQQEHTPHTTLLHQHSCAAAAGQKDGLGACLLCQLQLKLIHTGTQLLNHGLLPLVLLLEALLCCAPDRGTLSQPASELQPGWAILHPGSKTGNMQRSCHILCLAAKPGTCCFAKVLSHESKSLYRCK
jgi:hypothetical protein